MGIQGSVSSDAEPDIFAGWKRKPTIKTYSAEIALRVRFRWARKCVPHQQVEHTAAPTKVRSASKKTLANEEPTTQGQLCAIRLSFRVAGTLEARRSRPARQFGTPSPKSNTRSRRNIFSHGVVEI